MVTYVIDRPSPFRIQIPDDAVTDLHQRLERARWPDKHPGREWQDGADVDYIKEVCEHWRLHYDWRQAESALNALPQFVARIDGLDIHFVHVRGKGAAPRPLLVAHGWPSGFPEFQKLIPLLTDPAAHGGDPNCTFDIIAPSMPGFGFSQAPLAEGMHSGAVADLWLKLMRDVLGYDRFFAHGGDIGAHVVNGLARRYPRNVAAVHTMAAPSAGSVDDPSAAETSWLTYVDEWDREEGGYWRLQRTKPQSLAVGLNDSPAGLAAWILEKWHGWSECGGALDSILPRDELLTLLSLYWFTGTIGSSMRMYYENARSPSSAGERITIPARLFLTLEKVDLCPPEYARRSFSDLSYGVTKRGGHFLAAEAPDLLADDIRWFFSGCELNLPRGQA